MLIKILGIEDEVEVDIESFQIIEIIYNFFSQWRVLLHVIEQL